MGGPEGARAEDGEQGGEQGEGGGQHRRDPDRQDRAEPVGRLEVGDEQDQHRRDHGAARGGDRRHALAQGERQRLRRRPAAVELLAVAVDEQQRVVGAGAEDQHQQQHRPLRVDGDPARLDQQVGEADGDQVGGADDEQRRQRQQRRPVDEQEQQQDQAERRHQQRVAGFVGDPLEVGGDPGRPGDVGADPGRHVVGEVAADPPHAAGDGAAVGRVQRQHDQRRFAVAGERADAAGDRGDVAERLGGVGREGVDDRRRAGDRQPVEAVADPPDRRQVGFAQPAGTVEDDDRRHLFGGVAVALLAAGVERLDRPRRFRVGGQEAGLPGRGDAADPVVAEVAGDAERQPDRDRQPAPARPGDRGGESLSHGRGISGAPTARTLAPAADPKRDRQSVVHRPAG